MSTIVVGNDHFSYAGHVAACQPITGFVDRFVAAESESWADAVALLVRVMLDCAPKEEKRFALLRDEDSIYAMLTHSGGSDPDAYHARLAAEHGAVLEEIAEDWGTEPGDPDGDDSYTYIGIARRNR